MTSEIPGATQDYSTRSAAVPGPPTPSVRASAGPLPLRLALAAAGLTGAVLLLVATWTTVVEFRVLDAATVGGRDAGLTGSDLHGIALVPIAAFGLVLLLGALRGSRPAMIALAATGVLALGLVVGLDVPELNETGQLATFYENVGAGAATGFYLETLGAVLLLLAGGGSWAITTP